MQEKIITGRKYGMAVLLGYLALLAAAVLVPQPLQIPMYRSKIPARQIQTANDGRKQ